MEMEKEYTMKNALIEKLSIHYGWIKVIKDSQWKHPNYE